MAYRSLREFMAKLEAAGELVRVKEPVSTVLEMTEIQTRLLATGGPAVLFENPVMANGEPSPMPALANLFGTVKRVAMGVTLGGQPRTTGAELREVGELLAFLRQPEPPRGLKDAVSMLPAIQTVLSMRPNTVKRAPVQQVTLRGARRRSRHDPGGGDAGAGHAVGVSVCGPPARRQARPRPGQDPTLDGPGPGRDHHRGPSAARRIRRRGALRRPHRLLQFGRALPGVPGDGDLHAQGPDLSDHLHRPAARRTFGAG